MSPPVDTDLVDFAVTVTRRAGEITLRWFGSTDLRVDTKDDGSPVTQADLAAEHFIRHEIAAAFPADSVTGEEEAAHAGSSSRVWTIDPVDGTKAFTRGVPLYANLLALDDEHGPAIGVINIPALHETVWAGRGRGCFHNGAPCRVSTTIDLAGSYATTSGLDYWPPGMLDAALATGLRLRTWGDGYGYVLVATGRVDAMIDPVAAFYDVAPMRTILHEAGGRFTDLAGTPRHDGGSGLATNGLLHHALLGAIGPYRNSVSG